MMNWTRGATLGKGGFAFVSIAKTHSESAIHDDHHLPPVVAVKSAKVSESGSLLVEKEFLDKFQGCPCIVRCFGEDITTENGEKLYNILLEYASRGCVADRIIPRKGMPETTVGRYTKSILTALLHIHKLGYVHCDVKPHNMLILGHEDDVKLADFGSCYKISNDDEKKCDDFRGTFLYAAPESISRQSYVPESDVWALGCSVLHMLTGKSPWEFDKKAEVKDVLLKIGCGDEIPEIPTNNKISKEAKDFLKKCLVKDPTVRWKVDMLLDHPFVKVADIHHRNNRSSHHHHQHHVSRRLSHGIIHSLVPHCFHVPKVRAC